MCELLKRPTVDVSFFGLLQKFTEVQVKEGGLDNADQHLNF